MQSENEISELLKPSALAGVDWINKQSNTNYELTGLVGTEELKNIEAPFQLGLVLCDGEICAREQVLCTPTKGGYKFEHVEMAAPDIPPLLDPPVGIRSNWIDEQLKKYEFIVLLYYRGLW